MKIEKIINKINEEDLGTFKEYEPMSNHTSVKTGGKVRLLFIPNSVDGIIEVIKESLKNNITIKILGRGSNILFPDQELNIIVIKIANNLNNMEVTNDNKIIVEGGYPLQKLAKVLSKKGFKGLEFAGGIPGSVGGALYMNAGAHSGEMSEIVEKIIYLDENLNLKSLTKAECDFSYRHSIFQNNNWIILKAIFKMEIGDKASIFKQMSGNLEYRKEMQPLKWPSFGSVFKNPPGHHAGKLIESLGLKGYIIGGAQISEKHANFIINIGDATTQDIKNLIKYIKEVVKREKNIELETEVEMFLEGLNG